MLDVRLRMLLFAASDVRGITPDGNGDEKRSLAGQHLIGI